MRDGLQERAEREQHSCRPVGRSAPPGSVFSIAIRPATIPSAKNDAISQAIEEQLERTGMPLDPRFDKAEEALAEFGRKFWDTETEAAERRRLVAALIDRVAGQGRRRGRQATRALDALLPSRR
jgi:hypothetical protein